MECKTCKYWEENTYSYPSEWEKDFGLCTKTEHDQEVCAWDEDYNWNLLPEYSEISAVVVDGSGYYAALKTRSTHFCAMYSES